MADLMDGLQHITETVNSLTYQSLLSHVQSFLHSPH